jgi:hypothetical protein
MLVQHAVPSHDRSRWWAVLSLAVCAAVHAQESLFVAHVERVTLTPNGGPYCADPCAANGRRNSDGSTRVCISNDGGCQNTELVADRVLLGDMQPGPHAFDARIGEFGGTPFPVTQGQILVHVSAGLVEWAPILDVRGRQRVLVRMFRHGGTVGGVDLRALAQGSEDGVALDDVVDRLPTRR